MGAGILGAKEHSRGQSALAETHIPKKKKKETAMLTGAPGHFGMP